MAARVFRGFRGYFTLKIPACTNYANFSVPWQKNRKIMKNRHIFCLFLVKKFNHCIKNLFETQNP